MAPKSKAQFNEQKLEKREMILGYALEVFASHGYHGASVSTIANHAGIAKGLLYTYFENKEDLLRAILKKGVQDLIQIFVPYADTDLTKDIFRSLILLFFKTLEENASFWRLYFAIAMQPNVLDIMMKEFEPMVNSYIDLLQKYYKSQGSKNPKVDALLAHALLDGITLNYIMAHHDFDMNKMQELAIIKLENPSF